MNMRASTLAALERPMNPNAPRLAPPEAGEYDSYYARYIERVPEGDFLEYVRRQVDEVADLFGAFTPAQADFAYAPGKWTIKEVLGHMTDVERLFAYRALSFARRDPSALPSFDQNAWIAPAEFGRRSLDHLLEEWIVVRASTLMLIEGLPAGAPMLRGTASGHEFTVRALLYLPPGHVDYHLEIIRDRYIGAEDW